MRNLYFLSQKHREEETNQPHKIARFTLFDLKTLYPWTKMIKKNLTNERWSTRDGEIHPKPHNLPNYSLYESSHLGLFWDHKIFRRNTYL